MKTNFTPALFLLSMVGIFIAFFFCKEGKEKQNNATKLKNDTDSIHRNTQQLKKEILTRHTKNEANYALLLKRKEAIEKIEKEVATGFPWAAKTIVETNAAFLEKTAFILENKTRPARKAAEVVRGLKASLKKIQQEQIIAKSQLEMYEALFPWLIDFKEAPPEVLKVDKSSPVDEDPVNRILAPSEQNLSKQEKFQLALERYWNRNKSNWEIGRDYERYIGYLYESNGFEVEYIGAIQGFEDMGRDVIATKEDYVHVIQCKYWSKTKTIHEKHIFQLYGTTVSYCVDQHKNSNSSFSASDFFKEQRKIIPVFATSTNLSEIARDVANALNVEVRENKAMESFPSIKCHVSRRTNEKIYHLPFDQQYDHIKMRPAHGDIYVKTVHEAESLGFRRAFKWRGNTQS